MRDNLFVLGRVPEKPADRAHRHVGGVGVVLSFPQIVVDGIDPLDQNEAHLLL